MTRDWSPGLPRGWLVGRVPADWGTRLRELACVALHCDHRHLAQASAAAVRAAGFAVLVYTVNEAAVAQRLLSWPVDCVVTDALDRIGAEL